MIKHIFDSVFFFCDINIDILILFRFAGAIIRARFTEEKALALISDSGGSVFELSLKKTLGLRSYSSRCIFSGSRGEVCTFEPLNQGRIVWVLTTI